MLARWAAETATDEPEWSIDDIEPMNIDVEEPNQQRR